MMYKQITTAAIDVEIDCISVVARNDDSYDVCDSRIKEIIYVRFLNGHHYVDVRFASGKTERVFDITCITMREEEKCEKQEG